MPQISVNGAEISNRCNSDFKLCAESWARPAPDESSPPSARSISAWFHNDNHCSDLLRESLSSDVWADWWSFLLAAEGASLKNIMKWDDLQWFKTHNAVFHYQIFSQQLGYIKRTGSCDSGCFLAYRARSSSYVCHLTSVIISSPSRWWKVTWGFKAHKPFLELHSNTVLQHSPKQLELMGTDK